MVTFKRNGDYTDFRQDGELISTGSTYSAAFADAAMHLFHDKIEELASNVCDTQSCDPELYESAQFYGLIYDREREEAEWSSETDTSDVIAVLAHLGLTFEPTEN